MSRLRKLRYDSIEHAMNILSKAMKKDKMYAHGWHCNIAMAMYDEMPESFWLPDKTEQHKIANKAASNFMKLAFDVETSQEPPNIPDRKKNINH